MSSYELGVLVMSSYELASTFHLHGARMHYYWLRELQATAHKQKPYTNQTAIGVDRIITIC